MNEPFPDELIAELETVIDGLSKMEATLEEGLAKIRAKRQKADEEMNRIAGWRRNKR